MPSAVCSVLPPGFSTQLPAQGQDVHQSLSAPPDVCQCFIWKAAPLSSPSPLCCTDAQAAQQLVPGQSFYIET